MRLYEYMGKGLFQDFEIPVPQGMVVHSKNDGLGSLPLPAVIKAQVLSGKRGKGGGILFADTEDELSRGVDQLLESEIAGYPVEGVLIEERLDIVKELYLAITIDQSTKTPVVIASAEGGMDIEEVPQDQIMTRALDVFVGLPSYVVQEVSDFLGLQQEMVSSFGHILTQLYQLFRERDAELVEINPLVITGDNRLIAADAKVTIDDVALYRQAGLPIVEEATESEKKAQAYGLAYVELDGDIGVLANGAGITMGTLDTLQYYGGRASNFLDIGGGASVEKIAAALKIIVSSQPKVLLINIFGGITRCDDVATALVDAKNKYGLAVPVVIRMVGTNEREGVQILRNHDLTAYTRMEEAAREAVELANKLTSGKE